MAMIKSPQEAAKSYRERIMRLWISRSEGDISPWPGLTTLQGFINKEHDCTLAADISVVEILVQDGLASQISIKDCSSGQLPSLSDTARSSQLIIVENLCPDTLALLGGTYDIDPQFFAEHINILSWYSVTEKVPERLNSLPSTKRGEDFLITKYVVETRELLESDDAGLDAGSTMWPDIRRTRILQSAGKLKPISPQKSRLHPQLERLHPQQVNFPAMAFTRQTVSVWCRKKINGNGWIAIMLLDPPFHRSSKGVSLGQLEHRNPSLRPKTDGENLNDENRHSFRKAFCNLLRQKCSVDDRYLTACATDAFLILYEGYRIIASEWLVVNEYVKRELANIEYHLEKTEASFQQLEQHLKELYRIRRRCNKDRDLVTEAALQCKKRGQALWPSTGPPKENDAVPVAERYAEELEEDFQYVLDNMTISISRIEKNIKLLMALVTINEGRQGLLENKGIAILNKGIGVLTLVATTFLPSETVATILGMQTQYGPGNSDFWLLWVLSLPLTALVVTIPFLYMSGNKSWVGLFHRKSKTIKELQTDGLRDEDIELSNNPMRQMWVRDAV